MADLFGDFEATPAATGEVDPMAAFLAREQELLGDDAALFGNTTAAVPSSSSAVLAESAPGDLFSAVPDTDSVSHHSAVPVSLALTVTRRDFLLMMDSEHE